jgi:flagellar export protein FliJ
MAARLIPVLRLRKRTEEARAIALAVAVRDCAVAARRLQALRRQVETSRGAVVAALLAGAPAGDAWLDAELARRASAAAALQVVRVAQDERRVSEARAALVAAAQQRRAIERVLELRDAQVRHADEVQEQRRLDDVATTRAAHRIMRGDAA